MRSLTLFSLLLTACASVPADSGESRRRALYEGYTIDEVRQAALETVNDVARFISPARITEDGRVVSEYAASGWTSFEIRFVELAGAVAAEVRIEPRPGPPCSMPGPPGPVSAARLHAWRATVEGRSGGNVGDPVHLPRVAHELECRTPGRLSKREREILDEIRARLESNREPVIGGLAPS